MKGLPFFSIIIPTHNRPDYLNNALKTVLMQNFKNYEIVITDNSTNDLSIKLIKNINNKRIRLIKNDENIGFTRNLYKAIKLAQGRYIFMLGDDDMILRRDTLSRLYELINKYKYGFLRLRIIYHSNLKSLYSPYLTFKDNFEIKKNEQNVKVYNFLQSVIYTIISGSIFKNIKSVSIPLIEKSHDPNLEISDFWIKHVFLATKKYGGYYEKDYCIVNTPVYKKVKATKLYQFEKESLSFERIWQLIFCYFSNKEQAELIKQETEKMIIMLPSIKYYSDRLNLIRWIRRMLFLNKGLYKNPKLYIGALIALFMPNSLWAKLRDFIFKFSDIKEGSILIDFKNLNYILKK